MNKKTKNIVQQKYLLYGKKIFKIYLRTAITTSTLVTMLCDTF